VPGALYPRIPRRRAPGGQEGPFRKFGTPRTTRPCASLYHGHGLGLRSIAAPRRPSCVDGLRLPSAAIRENEAGWKIPPVTIPPVLADYQRVSAVVSG